MRIIAGKSKNIKIETIVSEETRPTLERVKENFFNAISFELEDKRVLDLFAGSGQLGLEALSRGAKECVFIDAKFECSEIIRKNAQKAKLYEQCNIMTFNWAEYLSGLKKRKDKDFESSKFDIVFLDASKGHYSELIKETIKKLVNQNFLNDNALIVCESNENIELDEEIIKNIKNTRIYKYGKVIISILSVSVNAGEDKNNG